VKKAIAKQSLMPESYLKSKNVTERMIDQAIDEVSTDGQYIGIIGCVFLALVYKIDLYIFSPYTGSTRRAIDLMKEFGIPVKMIRYTKKWKFMSVWFHHASDPLSATKLPNHFLLLAPLNSSVEKSLERFWNVLISKEDLKCHYTLLIQSGKRFVDNQTISSRSVPKEKVSKQSFEEFRASMLLEEEGYDEDTFTDDDNDYSDEDTEDEAENQTKKSSTAKKITRFWDIDGPMQRYLREQCNKIKGLWKDKEGKSLSTSSWF
jgi:hypothetical protein